MSEREKLKLAADMLLFGRPVNDDFDYADTIYTNRSSERRSQMSLKRLALARGIKPYGKKGEEFSRCIACGTARHEGGAGRCRPCYIQGAKSIYEERKRGLGLLLEKSADTTIDYESALGSDHVAVDFDDPLTILLALEEESATS